MSTVLSRSDEEHRILLKAIDAVIYSSDRDDSRKAIREIRKIFADDHEQ